MPDDYIEDRRAGGVVEDLRRRVANVDIGLVRLEGKVETIGVQIAANADQRERMEISLRELAHESKDIAHEFRLMNGRTRKNEDHIAALQAAQADHKALAAELRRALSTQSDGSVTFSVGGRPPMSGPRKVGAAAVGVPLVIGGIEVIRQGIELAIEWLKHGAR